MSPSLAPPPPAPSPVRGSGARLWRDPPPRATMIGLTAVVLVHLLLWLVGPRVLQIGDGTLVNRSRSTAREFNIELDPELLTKEQTKPKDPANFVETNPEAPENIPDRTNNFAAQNQQAAQEKPTPDKTSDRAATEGKKDFESNQIVSGRLVEPIERIEATPPPAPETPPVETPVAAPRAERIPLPGAEKFEGESETGFAGSLAQRLENARAVPEKIEGVKDAPEASDATSLRPAIDPQRPRPRPQIVRQQQVRPAILAENKFGTKNVGLAGIDARWSNYGQYLQKMIDTVQIQWERILIGMSALPSGGSTVTVKFVMNDQGAIANIVDIDSTANDTAERACVSAITDRAPYGPWTDDMKAVLGAQQELTFTFHYQ